ncbi:hypothetical protein AVEN_152190-1 [Araneus ventricosus]|uniref:Uncharacterized protein n=1 Tax=Araneus ventricosus TaxID=182803 RepID=A0A4Y2HLC0_ARAVE|nr:hypothetical protein AVEN_152190-1 [Araneus ventricosus]
MENSGSMNSKFWKKSPTNDAVINLSDTDSFKDSSLKPIPTSCYSQDPSGFTTVEKKKKRKNRSHSMKENNCGNTADEQSKFWTTSLFHVSNTDEWMNLLFLCNM